MEESKDEGWAPIGFNLGDINFDKLNRKHAFYHGVHSELSQAEVDTKVLHQRGVKLARFDKVGDVLPIEPIEGVDGFENITSSADQWSENHGRSTLQKFRLIKRRKLKYDKPLLIIYNPNSGKKTNFVPKITARLKEARIPFEMMPTQKALDPLNFARTIDFGKYSLLVAAGGDGTVHEVVNGMLMRTDKKRIPLAFLPNGSGDDLCSSIGIRSMDHGLDYICKGETIKIDTLRVLVDHDSEETLPSGLERYNYCRHQMINSGLVLPPLVAIKAVYWKSWFGKGSYTIATIIEALKRNLISHVFEISIDGKKVELGKDHTTLMMMAMNGKFCGGGMQILPYACINDGMADITWISDPAVSCLTGVASVMDKAKAGGVQVYDHQSMYMRGKQIVAKFKGQQITPRPSNYGPQLFNVDGEDLTYSTKITWDAIKQHLEVCFDSDRYFREHDWFHAKLPIAKL